MMLFGVQVRESSNVAVSKNGGTVTEAVILRVARTHGREGDMLTEQRTHSKDLDFVDRAMLRAPIVCSSAPRLEEETDAEEIL